MITAILNVISGLTTALNHAWDAFNSAPMVKAKQAQMSQDQLDAHRATIDKAMNGTPEEKAKALEQLRELAAE